MEPDLGLGLWSGCAFSPCRRITDQTRENACQDPHCSPFAEFRASFRALRARLEARRRAISSMPCRRALSSGTTPTIPNIQSSGVLLHLPTGRMTTSPSSALVRRAGDVIIAASDRLWDSRGRLQRALCQGQGVSAIGSMAWRATATASYRRPAGVRARHHAQLVVRSGPVRCWLPIVCGGSSCSRATVLGDRDGVVISQAQLEELVCPSGGVRRWKKRLRRKSARHASAPHRILLKSTCLHTSKRGPLHATGCRASRSRVAGMGTNGISRAISAADRHDHSLTSLFPRARTAGAAKAPSPASSIHGRAGRSGQAPGISS